MANEHDDLLFTAMDPNNYPVTLTSSRYYGHIISSDNGHQAHPEFTPAEIKKAIEKPLLIYESNRPNNIVYFSRSCSKYPTMYLKVAVNTYPDFGDITTAHLTPCVKGGLKEGGLIYAYYKSGL